MPVEEHQHETCYPVSGYHRTQRQPYDSGSDVVAEDVVIRNVHEFTVTSTYGNLTP